MTTQRVSAEKDDVQRQHDATHADSETIREPITLPGVVGKHEQEQQREVEEVTMNILDDERERVFSAIALARLTDRARGRVGPERLVIGTTIVVAGEAETTGRSQN